ncbi:MAG: metallophosphoesterase [Planctomycetales bacterium]
MIAVDILLICLTLFGNALLCIHFFNHSHSRLVSRWVDKTLDIVIDIWFLVVPLGFLIWYCFAGRLLVEMLSDFTPFFPMLFVVVCLGNLVITMGLLLARPQPDSPLALSTNHTTRLDLGRQLGPSVCVDNPIVRRLAALPGNQILELNIHEKKIRIPRLPLALEGFSIVHLTDLHFTGVIGKPYFDEVIRHANELDADLIAITGDLIDNPKCFDWIDDTLGQLRARHGVYYVLGNHDMRIDSPALRRRLHSAGLITLGSRWTTLSIHGATLVLAGNELPWFGPLVDMRDCPERDEEQLRVFLSHSPDQIDWAVEHDADLMLAGHTHGGQIRLPWIGPLASSSRMGSRYAGGTYDLSPTVLHVCRGISGTFPIRFNCPPELARLELHSAEAI